MTNSWRVSPLDLKLWDYWFRERERDAQTQALAKGISEFRRMMNRDPICLCCETHKQRNLNRDCS